MTSCQNELLLYTGSEIEAMQSSDSALTPVAFEACRAVVEWTRRFLCEHHEQLGRSGPVCPFTQPSLERRLFWLTVVPGATIDVDEASKTIQQLRSQFVNLHPRSGAEAILKTILIVLPELSHERARVELESLQKQLKPDFVRAGLMLGQFYEGCPEPGLWNDEFRPLQSPVPLLAIRNMVPSDFPFLHSKAEANEMLMAYFNRFGAEIPPEIRELLIEALESSDLTLRNVAHR